MCAGDGAEAPEPAPEGGARVSLLARRLADPEPGADEYLAAATVLAMKYGPAVLDQVNIHLKDIFQAHAMFTNQILLTCNEIWLPA